MVLSVSSKAQNSSVSLNGGITYSNSPIYTLRDNSQILTTQSIYKPTIALAYNHWFRPNFFLRNELSFKTLGGNSLNRHLDENDYFVHSVSLSFLSLSLLPIIELELGRYIVSAGLGASAGILVTSKFANYQFVNLELQLAELEMRELNNLDFGLKGIFEVKRIIANDFRVSISLAYYKGLRDLSQSISEERIYMSNSTMKIGLEIPIGK